MKNHSPGVGNAPPAVPGTGTLRRRRIVVTRPVATADRLCGLLASRGAVPIRMPLVRIAPPASWHDLDDALRCLGRYEWVILTSVNGVQAVLARLSRMGLGVEALRARKVAAVGPATRRALDEAGITAERVPSEYRGDRVAEALGKVTGQSILLARAAVATRSLPRILRESGAEVHEVPAYRTLPVEADSATAQIVREGVDAITFTSPSAVRSFVAGFCGAGSSVMTPATVATIGPTTSAMARDLGLPIEVEAAEHTMDGLVEALERHFSAQSGGAKTREAGGGV